MKGRRETQGPRKSSHTRALVPGLTSTWPLYIVSKKGTTSENESKGMYPYSWGSTQNRTLASLEASV